MIQSPRRLAAVAAVMLLAGTSLAGCGKQGPLERPAPLFGSRARAQYEAEKAQEAKDEAQRRAQMGEADPAETVQTPRREVLDPNQRNTPASSAPIPGAPNPFGGRTETLPGR